VSHPLLAELEAPDPARRVGACRACPDDPAATLLVEPLLERLRDPAASVVLAAAESLARIGRRDPAVRGLLRDRLRGRDAALRMGAALALARLEPPSPRLIPPLAEGLSSPSPELRWEAARTLVEVGRLHAEVGPLLLGLSRTAPAAPARAMAVHALRALAPDSGEVIDCLLAAAGDPEPEVRRAALAALSGLPAAADVVEPLLRALGGDPDPHCRALAAAALGARPHGAAGSARPIEEALERACSDPHPAVARAASRALGRLQR